MQAKLLNVAYLFMPKQTSDSAKKAKTVKIPQQSYLSFFCSKCRLRDKRYRKMLDKAESRIMGQLDLVKLIQR